MCKSNGEVVGVMEMDKFISELWHFGDWYSHINIFANKREDIS